MSLVRGANTPCRVILPAYPPYTSHMCLLLISCVAIPQGTPTVRAMAVGPPTVPYSIIRLAITTWFKQARSKTPVCALLSQDVGKRVQKRNLLGGGRVREEANPEQQEQQKQQHHQQRSSTAQETYKTHHLNARRMRGASAWPASSAFSVTALASDLKEAQKKKGGAAQSRSTYSSSLEQPSILAITSFHAMSADPGCRYSCQRQTKHAKCHSRQKQGCAGDGKTSKTSSPVGRRWRSRRGRGSGRAVACPCTAGCHAAQSGTLGCRSARRMEWSRGWGSLKGKGRVHDNRADALGKNR